MGYMVKWIEYGVYGDLIRIYPKPHSIYLRGTIDGVRVEGPRVEVTLNLGFRV